MMNTRFPLYFVLFILSLNCATLSAQKNCEYDVMLNANLQKLEAYKFIKFFPVETTKQDAKVEYSYLLNRDTRYRVVVADNGKKGERMMVTVRDRDKKVVASNKDKQTRSYSEVFDFVCPATGIYFFEAGFEDDRRDCGINILGFLK